MDMNFNNLASLLNEFKEKTDIALQPVKPSVLDPLAINGDRFNIPSWMRAGFSLECVRHLKPIHIIEKAGPLNSEQEFFIKEIESIAKEEILNLAYNKSSTNVKDYPWFDAESGTEKIYYSEDLYLDFTIKKFTDYLSVSIFILATDLKKGREIYKRTSKFVENDKKKTYLNVVSESCGSQLDLVEIGRPGSEFIKDNYADNVVKDFEYVTAQLGERDPNGRLTVIHGPPGTGKTYFLRGVMDAVDPNKTMVVYFQPELLKNYTPPKILSLFVDNAKDKNSIVLFIEDGDECLMRRGTDNMSVISAMLNFADGLIGNMLDIKIVVTSNAKKVDMDDALLRPGRLCKVIEVGKLSTEKASDIFRRLTEREHTFENPVTLAEVYNIAKENE